MDYGQGIQPTNVSPEQDFFTTGAGTNSEALNNVEPENNLNLDNNQSNWGTKPEVNPQAIGQAAIHQEVGQNEIESNLVLNEKSPELGQVVNLEMPPNSQEKASEGTTPAQETITFNRNNIRTTEKLDASGIKEVDRIMSKLNQTHDIADFYQSARDMMEANLENSYNRKLAA